MCHMRKCQRRTDLLSIMWTVFWLGWLIASSAQASVIWYSQHFCVTHHTVGYYSVNKMWDCVVNCETGGKFKSTHFLLSLVYLWSLTVHYLSPKLVTFAVDTRPSVLAEFTPSRWSQVFVSWRLSQHCDKMIVALNSWDQYPGLEIWKQGTLGQTSTVALSYFTPLSQPPTECNKHFVISISLTTTCSLISLPCW